MTPVAAVSRAGSVGPMDLSPRLRAVCDLDVAEVRENSGRHEYDGKPQDLSPDGVGPGWPGWPRRGPAASGSPTRTTRRT